MTNLEKYKNDIDNLIKKGEKLLSILRTDKYLIKFRKEYEIWYSESLSLIKIILPYRTEDFEKYYKNGEKCLKNYITYTPPRSEGIRFEVFDNISVRQADYAGSLFENQLGIVKAAKRRFKSSLFDIKQLVQADLFDSELDAATELNKKGFTRGAGAIAGVILEGHLAQVCENHKIKVKKKEPTINDYNQLLKDNNIIEIQDWRFIQHLADLRNLCDHNKKREPKKEEIEELINGVKKITKTIF
ncbi:MAG: hypothetical protein PHW38_06585 [Candidatus Cloacimonetes bacterium]